MAAVCSAFANPERQLMAARRQQLCRCPKTSKKGVEDDMSVSLRSFSAIPRGFIPKTCSNHNLAPTRVDRAAFGSTDQARVRSYASEFGSATATRERTRSIRIISHKLSLLNPRDLRKLRSLERDSNGGNGSECERYQPTDGATKRPTARPAEPCDVLTLAATHGVQDSHEARKVEGKDAATAAYRQS